MLDKISICSGIPRQNTISGVKAATYFMVNWTKRNETWKIFFLDHTTISSLNHLWIQTNTQRVKYPQVSKSNHSVLGHHITAGLLELMNWLQKTSSITSYCIPFISHRRTSSGTVAFYKELVSTRAHGESTSSSSSSHFTQESLAWVYWPVSEKVLNSKLNLYFTSTNAVFVLYYLAQPKSFLLCTHCIHILLFLHFACRTGLFS